MKQIIKFERPTKKIEIILHDIWVNPLDNLEYDIIKSFKKIEKKLIKEGRAFLIEGLNEIKIELGIYDGYDLGGCPKCKGRGFIKS